MTLGVTPIASGSETSLLAATPNAPAPPGAVQTSRSEVFRFRDHQQAQVVRINPNDVHKALYQDGHGYLHQGDRMVSVWGLHLVAIL